MARTSTLSGASNIIGDIKIKGNDSIAKTPKIAVDTINQVLAKGLALQG